MSGASKQRTRQERIESLGIPKPRLIQWWERSNKLDVSARIGIAVIAAATLLALCQTWKPPFAYRIGEIPGRDVITRVSFEDVDETATEANRMQKLREVPTYYRNRPQPLAQLRAALKNKLFVVLAPPSFDQMSEEERLALASFYEGDETAEPKDSPESRFAAIKTVLSSDTELKEIDGALDILYQEVFKYGLLQGLQHKPEEGSQNTIRVFKAGEQKEDAQLVLLESVRIAELEDSVRGSLADQFRFRFDEKAEATTVQTVAGMISDWIIEQLRNYETLQYDKEFSEDARQEAAAEVQPVLKQFEAGTTQLADAGEPLESVALLRLEWNALNASMTLIDRAARVAAFAGMIAALYLLCGSYIFFIDDRQLLQDRWKLAKVLSLMVATISLSYFAARDQWRCELVPLVLASIIAAVVYGRELSLLLMAAACISVTLLLGAGLSELVMMTAACTSCTLLLGRIRSRTHLLYVGCLSAGITIATVVGVGLVTGLTLSGAGGPSDVGMTVQGPHFNIVVSGLIRQALWAGVCIFVSAAAMTPLLSLVEKGFGVQTDLSLLELGDASHPLLRRLAQRAPGTYNHSINVASIGEAAAEAIGANGLLVRVGAYFHDIGKMFKPEYFIENQSAGINQHDSLQPAMSTLVIIAHVKDGADLARSHHLPDPIIDFILQHHGTTLVEYFYREAARRSEDNPNAESVSDKDFRYPGPKPQSLEAAVMMMADSVESASRTLVDPTPSRIQGLVDSIAQKKVADGQFDECGLTFRQLDRVRQSLVKSLTAIYHARVKYPGQQSA